MTEQTLNEILGRLGIDDAGDRLWSSQWPASQAPSTQLWQNEARLRQARQFAGLAESYDPMLLQVSQLLRASTDLAALYRHCAHVLFDVVDFPAWQNTRYWPAGIESLGDLTSAFYLLLGLEAIPRMLALHQRLGIPSDISRHGCSHYPASVQRLRDATGAVGMDPAALYWLQNHVRGDLYRLGRLEFMLKPFKGCLTAWRHNHSRAVIALASDGTGFDDAGIIAADDDNASWHSQLQKTDAVVSGTPISPLGRAEHRTVSLDLDDWAPELTAGDTILEVHIPAGGGMTPAACRASMQQALEFFPRHFPTRPFVGFACGSWILNPELEHIYSPESNMVQWQRELYLYPLPNQPDSRSGLHFVFGTQDIDLAGAPRDTSLRRALLDHLEAGGRLLGGGMFLLLEDFPAFGSQVYRHMAAP